MESHPFRLAWQTRDLEAWEALMAPDIVLHSPILRSPFRGRDSALELMEVLFEVIDRFDITDHLTSDDSDAFFWRAEIGGRSVQGADLVRYAEDGAIREITVLIRPLVDIATFASAVGPPLARRRSRLRGWVATAVSLPLRGMLLLVDVAATKVTKGR